MADMETPNFKYHIPEVIPFLLMFGSMLTDSVNTNFLIYRTCYALLNFNETECAKLGTKYADNTTEKLEQEVQPYANIVSMVLVWPAQILPAIFCLFVGPWSDKNGRKPILISAFIGFTISAVFQVGIALIPSLSPWYALIPSLVSVIFGGFSPVLMLIICYVTDITTDENRGVRLGLFEMMFGLGTLLGTFSSSFLLDLVGYAGVFATTGICNFLGLLYIIFILPETINTRNNMESSGNIASIDNVKEMFRALVRRRGNHLRAIILLSIVIMMFYIMSSADGGVLFYYLRAKFHWDLQKYTVFKSIRDLIFTVGSIIGLIVLHKWLKLQETTIALLSFILLCNSAIVQTIADKDWHIFFAACLRIISGTSGPMMRSFISKLVSQADIGKIFSITITLETLAMVISAPSYSLIYNKTIDYFPGAFNLFSASIFLINIILTITVIALKNKYLHRSTPYELLVDAEPE